MRVSIKVLLATMFSLVALSGTANAQVVISQVYGGGGNTGATLRSDFIELHNNGITAVNLSTWSVQYASSTGTTWTRTNLTGSIAAGGYFLVKQADGTGGTVNLPAPDVTGTIAMSGTAGKVALVNNQTSLSGACPLGATVADFVGYGTTANCSETAPTAAPSNTASAIRAGNGCTDTGNNNTDFAIAAANPRNTASTMLVCGATSALLSINDVARTEGNSGTTTASFTVSLTLPAPAGGVTFDIATADNTATTANSDYVNKSLTAQTIPAGSSNYTFDVTINGDTTVEPNESFFVNIINVTGATVSDGQGVGTINNDDVLITPIHSIQGTGNTSPLVGTSISTRGIVTGLRTNGFFMQTADADADANPATSQGIFVFTSSAPTVALADNAQVTGTVTEFPSTNPLPLTEITSPSVIVLSSGNALPASVTLTSADANATSALNSLERYEGMRVTASLIVVAPASGFISEANATSTGNGVFYGVLPGVGRPFREKGISVLDPYATPVGVDVWDSNPERIRVQSTGFGGAQMNPSVGDTLSNISGVLDYGFGAYTLVPYSGQTFTAVTVPTPVSTADAEEFTVAGFNLLRFFDTVNDPAISDPVLTATALNNRLGKTANAICEYVKTPDILGVVEVENLGVLQQLATTINNGNVAGGTTVPSCNSAPNYVAYLVEGNDVGGIDVGFLISTKEVNAGVPRVEVLGITQENKNETFLNPDSSTSILNDRPTLRLQAIVHHANGASYPVTVMINHMRSLSGVNDTTAGSNGWATNGERIRAKRLKQAESLAALIQARQVANANEKIMLLGDFNAFEFSDGYVDSMGIITGQQTAVGTVVNHSGFVVTTPLTNMTTVSAANDKYSFSFDGSSQSLDHAVINQALLMEAGIRSEHARINSDFAEILFGNYSQSTPGVYDIPVRVSDHDPVVLYVKPRSFVDVDLSVAVSNPDTSINAGMTTTFTINATNLDASLAVDNAHVILVLDAAISGVNVTAPAGWNCSAPVVAAASTTIDCSTLTFAANSAASFSVSVPVPAILPDSNLTLSASISADQSDPATANNISSDFVTIIGKKTDLAIRTRGAAKIYVGYKTRINTVADNFGPDAAIGTAIAITTNGPKSAFKITSVPVGWTCIFDAAYPTARFLCNQTPGNTFAVGPRPEFVMTFTAPQSMASTTLIVGSGISAATTDPTIGNNESSYSLYIDPLLQITPPSIPVN